MQSTVLGRSSLSASRLAYGCWRLAGTWDSSVVDEARMAAGRKAVLAAWEAGYTFFDHADIYCDGVGETIFGQVLKGGAGDPRQSGGGVQVRDSQARGSHGGGALPV